LEGPKKTRITSAGVAAFVPGIEPETFLMRSRNADHSIVTFCETEENLENSHSGKLLTRPIFKPCALRMQVYGVRYLGANSDEARNTYRILDGKPQQ
jgi:hypothetical protein